MRWMVVLAWLASPASAQELYFEIAPTQSCLAQAQGDAKNDCVGLAADACMQSPDGGTTVGMSYCLDAEREWWDARLNSIYGLLMEQNRAADAENAQIGATHAPPLADGLRAMQRAWIAYRDAACDYEMAQWGGGTGGGPAITGCLLYETARQTLSLEAHLQN